ncbi:MAG: hypothetical protein PUE12_02870 [Oscillospiraceae bacterium]|nr:hypothetical protein [Oscillospiraceae bacterium]
MKNTLKRLLALFSAILISFLPFSSCFVSALVEPSNQEKYPYCFFVDSFSPLPSNVFVILNNIDDFSKYPGLLFLCNGGKQFYICDINNPDKQISTSSCDYYLFNSDSFYPVFFDYYTPNPYDQVLCIKILKSDSSPSEKIRLHCMNTGDFTSVFSNNLADDSIYNWHGDTDLAPFYCSPSLVSPSISSPDEPDHTTSYPLFWGVRIGIEKKPFLDWLRSEGKLSLINSPGFDFVDSQLDTLIDIFDSYGNNPFSFLSSLCKTFNITTDIKAAVSLVQTIQQLYRDYQDYKNSSQLEAIRPSSASHPHWRTDKDDVSLTTDHEDDTTIISILREILRTLIHLPENISVYFNFLNSRFNDISYNFQSEINSLNNLPDQISSLTYNSLINPLTEIKDAINNIDVSSPDVSVDVSISEEKQNEINTFFSDWNVKYSTAINEKIPVISQLSGLFNDQFFEKCGIDINGDGQVYQYYSTSVSYDSSSVSGTSSDSVSENDDFVNLLCSQFDNSDPNFLDDVSYSEDVPSLSISIAGKKTEIFDFRLFAKYRTQIHTIMIFCIYSLYFLSLYKSLPSIIGNVSDVTNAFSDYKQSKKE